MSSLVNGLKPTPPNSSLASVDSCLVSFDVSVLLGSPDELGVNLSPELRFSGASLGIVSAPSDFLHPVD